MINDDFNDCELMGKIYIAFQLDTEDFINEATDDVLIELVKIFDKHDVKVTFAIVGEKARALERRNRRDVIEALRKHDIAYQSNLHSVHPVITEYVRELDWSEGVEEVIRRELEGVIDIARIFGKWPKAFVQPGGSWTPQAVYAIRKMRINVYADGIFESGPFWYCGVLGIRYTIHFREDKAHLDDYLKELKEEFEAQYSKLKDMGGVIIILLHPCMLVTKEFWDALNFAKGVNNDRVTYSVLYPTEIVRAKLRNLDKFVQFLKKHDVEFVTLSELYDLFKEPSKVRLTMNEIEMISDHFARKLKYLKLGRHYISPAEAFYALSSFLSSYYLEGKLPSIVECAKVLGPIQKPRTLKRRVIISLSEFLKKVCEVKLYLNAMGVIPHEIKIERHTIGPGDFMKAMASICLKLLEKRPIREISVEPFRQAPELDFDLEDRVKRGWKWIIFPEKFSAPRILEYTLLQSWTLKPAVLRKEMSGRSSS